MKNTQVIIIVLVLIGLLFLFSSCSLKCGSENYLSLPFAGGDVRTFQKDPHMIEDPLWREMDSLDTSQGMGDYPK